MRDKTQVADNKPGQEEAIDGVEDGCTGDGAALTQTYLQRIRAKARQRLPIGDDDLVVQRRLKVT